ncbi:MAG: 1,6-anhydro-N-acetylmuramyl-L-alanine amidase AmpD [Magnetococcales bacterium]|nr:1,6-anhydro-N-acetylmuramyl-L-alanine amidase AmpD [Magnetococcales bacterium]
MSPSKASPDCRVRLRYLPSPHRDARPAGAVVDLVVLHAISLPPGHFGGRAIDELFLGRLNPREHPYFKGVAKLKVSAHFLIDRQGQVTQYVPVLKRAWHAGVSRWQGRRGCNDFSVGIELEGDEHTPFTKVQYMTLAGLIRTLQTRLSQLRDDRIVGHQHVAPERKWDPGPHFDWGVLRWWLAASLAPPPAFVWPLIWEE